MAKRAADANAYVQISRLKKDIKEYVEKLEVLEDRLKRFEEAFGEIEGVFKKLVEGDKLEFLDESQQLTLEEWGKIVAHLNEDKGEISK